MTSFVHVDHPTEHPGVVRAERVVENFKQIGRQFDATRASASMLLAAAVAALVVVANQVVETWTEGHLMVAWIVMWAVVFASLALLTQPARRAAGALRTSLKAWAAARRADEQDRLMWNAALSDARLMADINRAMSAEAVLNVKVYY